MIHPFCNRLTRLEVFHVFSIVFFASVQLYAADTISHLSLNASIDHLVLDNDNFEVAITPANLSFDQINEKDFISGALWDSIHPDVNSYNALARLKFINASDYPTEWLLNVPGNYITSWVVHEDGRIDTFRTGNLVRRSERPVPSTFKINSFIPLSFQANDSLTVFCEIRQSRFYPVNRREFHISKSFVAEWKSNDLLRDYGFNLGFFTAAILILALYCLVYFLFSRERYALLLALWCLATAIMFQGYHSGIYRLDLDPKLILYLAFMLANVLIILDLFFLSSFLRKEFSLEVWPRWMARLAIIIVVMTTAELVIYYYTQHFFLILAIIALTHGLIDLIRLVLGIYLYRLGSILHKLVGATLIITMLFLLTSMYFSYNSNFYAYTLIKMGSCISAFGMVTALGYIAVISRKESIASDTRRIIADSKVAELEEMNLLKSRLFTNIAHELRTPLSLILGPVQSILGLSTLGATEEKMLSTAERNATELLTKVNAILDLSKLDSNTIPINENVIEPYPIIQQWINNYEEIAKDTKVALHYSYKSDSTQFIIVDAEKIRSILDNLISNGIKAMPQGGRLSISVNIKEGNISIDVTDTGVGISEEEHSNIFDRFYQVDVVNTTHLAGTGIGLAICKEYVEILDGSIKVESEVGVGSTFSISVPIKTVSGAQIAEDARSKDVGESSDLSKAPMTISKEVVADGQGDIYRPELPNILIVEDNYDFRDFLMSSLKKKFNLYSARQGLEALDYLRSTQLSTDNRHSDRNRIDLIITDLMMPIMGGYELIDELQKDPDLHKIPVIILTARSDMDSRERAIRVGVDSYIVKPFENEELLTNINVLLDRSYRRNQAQADEEIDLEDGTHEVKPERHPEWLVSFEAYVMDHLSDYDLTQEKIAKEIFLSKRQVHRKMKTLIGITPNQYIQEIRLEKSKELLIAHECQSIKEVASTVGFKKPSYFSTLFYQRYGKRPSAYFDTLDRDD